MTHTTPVVPSLLDAIGERNRAAANERERKHADATKLYWTIVGRIADGDETGGTDPKTFAALLETLGTDLAGAKGDVTAIQSTREAERQGDAAQLAVTETREAHRVATEAEDKAKQALEAATVAVKAANWRAADAQETRNRAAQALRDARQTAAELSGRGFTGTLLRPEEPKPPRLVRFIAKAADLYAGAMRQPGDTFALPDGASIDPNYTQDAALPWPPRKVKRRLRAQSNVDCWDLGIHARAGQEFECEIVDGAPLPAGCVIVPDTVQPAPVAVGPGAVPNELLEAQSRYAASRPAPKPAPVAVADRLNDLIEDILPDDEVQQ